MTKPTEDELQEALREAERRREAGADAHHLAKALLYQQRRLTALQAVYDAVQHYLHSGKAEPTHGRLIRAVEEARAAETKETRGDGGSPWLE